MLQEPQTTQIADLPAGDPMVGKASLERLAIDLLDHSPGLELPEPGSGPSQPFDPWSSSQPSETELVLRLEDMLGDRNDEVVLLADSGQRPLALAADAEVVARGTAAEHVTADGQDVSGFAFVTFATGMTLFYPDDIELAVLPEG